LEVGEQTQQAQAEAQAHLVQPSHFLVVMEQVQVLLVAVVALE
jgi:hypothetical protein